MRQMRTSPFWKLYSTNRKEYQRLIAREWRDNKFGAPARPQDTFCFICGKSISGRQICLDHDHKTERFRAWLCLQCNSQLGWFENNAPQIMGLLKLEEW